MSRVDGFAVMDVSVDIVNDPKVRRLFREEPDLAGAGFIAYIATMGESWKAGRRVSIEDSWPGFLPADREVVDALKRVKLLDVKGLVSSKAWRGWFASAYARREAGRERWRRANDKRGNPSTNDSADTTLSPRGSTAVTGATVPFRSVPNRSVPNRTEPNLTGDSPPPPAERGRRSNGTNPRALGASPRRRAANPRAQGTSPRKVRDEQKRGSTGQLADLLRQAANGHRDEEPK